MPVLLLTGTVGVGKSSVATEASELLDRAGAPHAFVDVDALRWCYPRPPADPFQIGLTMRNLAAVWSNFWEAGTTRLVLADVVTARADFGRYQEAVPDAEIMLVRLTARARTLAARVRARETGAALERHLQRAAELGEIMERAQAEDVLVGTDGQPIAQVAHEVLIRRGWLGHSRSPRPPTG